MKRLGCKGTSPSLPTEKESRGRQMTGEQATTKPQLDDDTRALVRRILASKLLEIDDIKKVVASLMAQGGSFTPQRLADGLVGANLLTEWQAKNLLGGKSRGFFLGSYRLLRPLGKGGMGIVFLGEHQVMKRMLALKVLPQKALENERRIERFKEEARASGQLEHQNIVRAHDFAQDGDKFYIVMEYVDGIDLHQVVKRDGVMTNADALGTIIQISEALSHAHERGIIHRDIKPSNILLRADGVVKVSDFGLARISWQGMDDVANRRLLGTADFIAPEQALDPKSADTRADIYSLGCTFFFLLTGRPPFAGENVQQKLAKHQTAPPPDLRTLRSDCPPGVAELVSRMLAKKPEDRPRSCIDLLSQLERLAGRTGESALEARHVPASLNSISGDGFLSSDGGSGSSPPLSGDVDFSNLPPVDLGAVQTALPVPSAVPNQFPASQGVAASKPKKQAASATAPGQQVLLGIGLALAVIALLFTVGVMIYSLNQPEKQVAPKIKAVEDGKNGSIIVVGQ